MCLPLSLASVTDMRKRLVFLVLAMHIPNDPYVSAAIYSSRIMTFNVQNFNDAGNWPVRVQGVARIINTTDPDYLVVQELREILDSQSSQYDDLKALIPQLAHSYWFPTMNYTTQYPSLGPVVEGQVVLDS